MMAIQYCLNTGEAGSRWAMERINHALRSSNSVEIEEHRPSLRLSCQVHRERETQNCKTTTRIPIAGALDQKRRLHDLRDLDGSKGHAARPVG